MANIVVAQGGGVPNSMKSTYYDMGDTTHALVVSLGGAAVLLGVVTLGAGEAHVGQVGGEIYTVSVNPVLTNAGAGAYTAGDYVGTSGVAFTIANAVRVAGGSAILESAVLIDKALQSASMELWLFDTAPTPPADNAAWTISDADALTAIPGGVIPFQTYYASALNSQSPVRGLGLSFNATAASRDIYGCLVTRGTPTLASLDLMLRMTFLQD